MPEDPFLSIVIPAYNEALRIPETLRTTATYLKQSGKSHEILVIDDGSTDQTQDVVKSLEPEIPSLRLIPYTPNHGKGYAVRCGILEARGKYILMSDADLSTPIEEFDRFLPYLMNGASIVIGTRKHSQAQILRHQPFWRESMGKVFTYISNLILGLHQSDFTCGFKAFEQSAARQIFSRQRIERWAFDSEILFLADRQHLSVIEVPVRWMNSPETKVHIVKDTLITFLSLWKIRFDFLRGKYEN